MGGSTGVDDVASPSGKGHGLNVAVRYLSIAYSYFI